MADNGTPSDADEYRATHGGSLEGYSGGTYTKNSTTDPRLSGKSSGEPDWNDMLKKGASLAEIAEKRKAWKKSQAATGGAAAQAAALKPSPSPSPSPAP